MRFLVFWVLCAPVALVSGAACGSEPNKRPQGPAPMYEPWVVASWAVESAASGHPMHSTFCSKTKLRPSKRPRPVKIWVLVHVCRLSANRSLLLNRNPPRRAFRRYAIASFNFTAGPFGGQPSGSARPLTTHPSHLYE